MERRAQFREEGAHFESAYYFTLLWMPPAEEAARAEGWLYEGKASTGVDPHELLRVFELGLGEVALAFAAASSRTDQAAITDIVDTHGPDGFAAEWLRHRDCGWAVELLRPEPRLH